jgi:uncharacterized membrane protein YcfT
MLIQLLTILMHSPQQAPSHQRVLSHQVINLLFLLYYYFILFTFLRQSKQQRKLSHQRVLSHQVINLLFTFLQVANCMHLMFEFIYFLQELPGRKKQLKKQVANCMHLMFVF